MGDVIYWLTNVDTSHWLVLALILLIAELTTGTTYLLWPAVAAGLTGLASLFFGLAFGAEVASFAVLTIALTLIGRPIVRDRLYKRVDATPLNERGASLIGARAVAVDAFANNAGSVKLGDTIWRAASADPVAAGQAVEIVGVEGATLQVRPVG